MPPKTKSLLEYTSNPAETSSIRILYKIMRHDLKARVLEIHDDVTFLGRNHAKSIEIKHFIMKLNREINKAISIINSKEELSVT